MPNKLLSISNYQTISCKIMVQLLPYKCTVISTQQVQTYFNIVVVKPLLAKHGLKNDEAAFTYNCMVTSIKQKQ